MEQIFLNKGFVQGSWPQIYKIVLCKVFLKPMAFQGNGQVDQIWSSSVTDLLV